MMALILFLLFIFLIAPSLLLLLYCNIFVQKRAPTTPSGMQHKFLPLPILLDALPAPLPYICKALISGYLILLASFVGWLIGIYYWLHSRDATSVTAIAGRLYDMTCTWCLGVTIDVEYEGESNDPKSSTSLDHFHQTGPSVVVCNHQSFLDVRCVASIWQDRMVIMAKNSLRYYPLLGWFMSFSGHIFIKRNDHESAIATLSHAAKAMKAKDTSILVFPEGTRGHGRIDGFLPFKKGAFHLAIQAQCPIVPVVFENYSRFYNKDKRIFKSGRIRAKVLAPIDVTAYSAATVDELIEEVRSKMSDAYLMLNKSK